MNPDRVFGGASLREEAGQERRGTGLVEHQTVHRRGSKHRDAKPRKAISPSPKAECGIKKLVRCLAAEGLKLKRGPALTLVLVLPFAFVLLDALVLKRALLHAPAADLARALAPQLPPKLVAWFWAGLFHPLLLAILPALLLRPEHRARAWKHVQAQPLRPALVYLARWLVLLGLTAASLLLVAVLLRVEWGLLARLQPRLAMSFPWTSLALVLGWLWLGGLPLLGLYLWICHRIDSTAVPVVFGLVGLMLTVALSGQELDPLWKRDLIPWMLPYACAQRPVTPPGARQETHVAGQTYRFVEQEIKPPKGGRTFKIVIVLPDPPPPTPGGILAGWGLGLGAALAGLGLLDARRRNA